LKISELIRAYGLVRIVEVTPPRYQINFSVTVRQLRLRMYSWLEMVRRMSLYCDAIAIADLKETEACHVPPALLARELKREGGIEPMPSIALRDYSKGALLNVVVGCLNVDIRNLLVVRGDPHKKGEGLEGDLFGFKRVADALREIRRLVGEGDQAPLCLATALDHRMSQEEEYVEVLRQREKLVDFYVAQPFFMPPERYLELIDDLKSKGIRKPILHSIFPLLSQEDIEVVTKRFGWTISEEERKKVSEGPGAGIELAAMKFDYLLKNKGRVAGVYVSSRNRPELIRLVMSAR